MIGIVQLLCYALQYSTRKGTVNVDSSVMITSALHLIGNEKKKEKKSDHGRIAFYEHGGKSGMAMIKYPGYRKNAQGPKRALYPGLGSVSLDR